MPRSERDKRAERRAARASLSSSPPPPAPLTYSAPKRRRTRSVGVMERAFNMIHGPVEQGRAVEQGEAELSRLESSVAEHSDADSGDVASTSAVMQPGAAVRHRGEN